MAAPPPALPNRDTEHLSLLGVFHWVFAGLSSLGLVFLLIHYLVMWEVMTNPAVWEQANQAKDAPPFDPADIFALFQILYLLGAIMLLAQVVLNMLSAVFLRKRRHRLFSQVVAGLDCLSMPFGTVLGIFTLIVLGRESVRCLYGEPTVSRAGF